MKTHTLRVLCILSGLFGAAVQALSAPYAGVSVGYMIDGEEEIYIAHAGMTLVEGENMDQLIELEVAYTSDEAEGVSADVMPLMVNYKLAFKMDSSITPYIGVGIGLSWVDVSVMGMSDDDTAFTYQAIAGLDYAIDESISLVLGYRYFSLEDTELFGFNLGDLDDSVIEVGVRFRF